ncbi:hypothetical protein QC761_700560 [Podospora bellae-mahoneyi]|uniref:DUF4604 domain-containing protein n=1 Tax=Podospora bellae-mahoneyi TaxID=2093777 RepID=A0ABR0F9W1_9PEZI|nr:hypothetical protein QC761_700560 [Podospora bellae-mahoneyi]
MPPKITAKNLQYNTTLPPFLARLRGEATSSSEFDGGGPDPILAARRRPTKKRSGSAEAEDAPTIVDEHGNTVQDVTVGVDGSVKATASAPVEEEKGGHDDSKPAAEDQAQPKAASIGAAGKKRRVGKVVGADADEEEDQKKDAAPTTNTKAEDKEGTASAPKAKPKRKAKKIKLSFGDDEG